MKKLSFVLIALLAVFVSCKKTPQVNIQYVDVEREVLNIGSTTANIQCDYEYIATLKSAKLYYGRTEDNMNSMTMRVVQSVLYAETSGLSTNTTYKYYYEFENGFNSMKSGVKAFTTEEIPTTVILPTVFTADITEITATSAVCGGEVTNDGGGNITERGVCWSTSPNPTIDDSHTTNSNGVGAFVSNITDLTNNTKYHVSAYATNEAGTAYGMDRVFVTSGGGSGNYEWVDLGLPSGLLWATRNVGADFPEDYGDYFAWAETSPKDDYDWSTYSYCCYNNNNGTFLLTKYCSRPDYGYNGYTDDLTILQADDDAATANWGDGWRTPTLEEWIELSVNCTSEWTTQNSVNGLCFTGTNGNSLFLPAAGFRLGDHIDSVGSYGYYWSSSTRLIHQTGAWFGYFHSGNPDLGCSCDRCFGNSVRAVHSARRTNTCFPPRTRNEKLRNHVTTKRNTGTRKRM